MASIIKQPLAGALASVLLGYAVCADAGSYYPRTDNAVAAWNARTGETTWTYRPATLTDAFLELRPGRLIVHLETPDRPGPELDPATGSLLREGPLSPAPLKERALAKSHSFGFSLIVLDNGWRIRSFAPGYDTALVFRDRAGRQVWKIDTHEYPKVVRARGNMVFWSADALGSPAAVHAQRAGRAKEAWRFDVASRAALRGYGDPHAPELEIVGAKLYAQSRHHVFVLDAESGSLIEHLDLRALTGLPWEDKRTRPAFYGGGLSEAAMVHDTTTILFAYERRVVALDASSHKLLWHKDPGGFPSHPSPALHDGVLYLTVGTSRAAPPPATVTGKGEAMSAPHPSSEPSSVPAPPVTSARPEHGSCAINRAASAKVPRALACLVAALLFVARSRSRLRRSIRGC